MNWTYKDGANWPDCCGQRPIDSRMVLDLGEHSQRSRYELLIRMVDPSGDLIPPGTFLYLAESAAERLALARSTAHVPHIRCPLAGRT